MSETPQDLLNIHQELWRTLSTAVGDFLHPYRFPTLATIGHDSSPELRTVVLRRVSINRRELVCFSDSRAPKVTQIRANPSVAWCFFNPATGVQIRAAATAEVLTTGDGVETHWAGLEEMSMLNYASSNPPGDAFDGEPVHEALARYHGDSGSLRAFARGNFAVISARVRSIDWLQLGAEGNRRTRFDLGPEGRISATWVQA